MWDAAAARASDTGSGHVVSIGQTDADFASAMMEAEALICDVGVIKAQFPCAAPRLQLLFVTNAGLDRLAPFDWLPPGAILDVFRQEPLPATHPFWTSEGIIVLPHIGGGHPKRDEVVARLFVDNLGRFLDGKPLREIVDRAAGY